MAAVVFWLLIVVGLVWTGLWGWVLLSSRQPIRELEVVPRAAALRRRLLVPVLIVLGAGFLVSLRWVPYPVVRAATLGQPQVSVTVTGQQWSWALSQTRVPAHVPIEFVVTSQDMNHDFAIYNAQGQVVAQVQAMPGYTNHLIYAFDQPGTYTIRCLEYCGVGHQVMLSTLAVE